ncbi:MAG TPA: M48 family metallopeptidase [Candidatus Binatia bacterium]|nr:M48 family metallopeptidase [Candidatus Binatia bacterium]
MKRLVGMKHVPKICLAGAIVMLITAPWDAETSGKERGRHRDTRSGVERQSARLHAIMLPLLRNTDRRLPLDQVRVSIVDDPQINAGSGGNGEFFVTTGLLNQATDEQLRGVLAHEVAHEDLGHPMKAQVLGTGLGLGAALLEQLFPGSGTVAPIAGTLITGHYSKPMELAADRHAVKILQRAGYSKATMINTLGWLMRRNGDSGGGIFATHPATSERIQALRTLR